MASARHIVCPHCAATNRVPRDRPAQQGRCGACHKALFEGRPLPVDAVTFRKHRDGNGIAVLLDVWAPWCGPCRAMAPMFKRAAAELEPEVRLLKVNADQEPGVAAELGVAGIPALFLMRGGRIVARRAGAMDARNIVAWTREHLGEAQAGAMHSDGSLSATAKGD
jgi:thioredoxin 2